MSLLIVISTRTLVKSYKRPGLPHTPRGLHAGLFARFARGTHSAQWECGWVPLSGESLCSLGRGAGAGRAARTCYPRGHAQPASRHVQVLSSALAFSLRNFWLPGFTPPSLCQQLPISRRKLLRNENSGIGILLARCSGCQCSWQAPWSTTFCFSK